MVFFFYYGSEYYCVRVGLMGQRPLVYAAYAYNVEDELPAIAGQTYRTITKDQFDWLVDHRECNVSYLEEEFAGRIGNLQCRSHGMHFRVFDDSPTCCHSDRLDDRQV